MTMSILRTDIPAWDNTLVLWNGSKTRFNVGPFTLFDWVDVSIDSNVAFVS